MIKYYVMRNSHFRIDFSNQSPQWSRHCERPRVPAERGRNGPRVDPEGSIWAVVVVVLGFTPMLRDRDAFDSFVGPLATLSNGTNVWSQGDVRRFCVWSRHLVFRKPGKDIGTVSGHSTSFVPTEIPSSGNRIYFLAISHYTILNMRLP